jgi:hypothetical protein
MKGLVYVAVMVNVLYVAKFRTLLFVRTFSDINICVLFEMLC